MLSSAIYQDCEKAEALKELQPFRLTSLSFRNPDWQSEAKAILRVGLPISFSISCRIWQFLTDQAVLGHLGTDYLAAAALAQVWLTMSGSFVYAFASTVNVLSSQAFGHNPRNPLVSQWFQLGTLLTIFICLPIIIAWMFTADVLSVFTGTHHTSSDDDDDDSDRHHIIHLAAKFAMISALYIIPNAEFMTARMYFKAQSIVLPATIVNAVFLVVNAVFNLIFVFGFMFGDSLKFGFAGSPLSTVLTRVLSFVVYMIYMMNYKGYHRPTWSACKLETFSWRRTKAFMLIAIPNTLGKALQDWQIQIIALFAARLKTADLATFSSQVTVVVAFHCILIGIGEGVGVRVGNLLGAGRPVAARYTAYVGLSVGFLFGALMSAIVLTLRGNLGRIMSNDHEIIQNYEDLSPIFGSGFIPLAIFTVSVSILTNQARVKSVAISSVVCCWFVSVPLAYVLGLQTPLKLYGIWIGIMTGYFLFFIISFSLVLRSDWKKAAIDAVRRSKRRKADRKGVKTIPVSGAMMGRGGAGSASGNVDTVRIHQISDDDHNYSASGTLTETHDYSGDDGNGPYMSVVQGDLVNQEDLDGQSLYDARARLDTEDGMPFDHRYSNADSQFGDPHVNLSLPFADEAAGPRHPSSKRSSQPVMYSGIINGDIQYSRGIHGSPQSVDGGKKSRGRWAISKKADQMRDRFERESDHIVYEQDTQTAALLGTPDSMFTRRTAKKVLAKSMEKKGLLDRDVPTQRWGSTEDDEFNLDFDNDFS